MYVTFTCTCVNVSTVHLSFVCFVRFALICLLCRQFASNVVPAVDMVPLSYVPYIDKRIILTQVLPVNSGLVSQKSNTDTLLI